MPSRCFVCGLKGKGCVRPLGRQSCDACQRMHVECIPCPIKISNVVKKSIRARECLEEVRALASGDPRCVEIALLPKTREFLSSLQSSPGDTAGQSTGGARIPQPFAIVSPAVVLPTTTHGWVNQVGTVSANEGSSIAVPQTNGLGNIPVINDPAAFYPPSSLGLYEYVGNIDEPPLLDFGSVPYSFHVPNPVASSSASESISHSSTSLLEQVIPIQERTSCGGNWGFLTPNISYSTVNYELAGSSTVLRSQSEASSHETRGETLGNATASWSEDAVSCLRSLAWSMGYCLIPRGAAIPSGSTLV
ncbi:uncharacterized protein EI90DRAFT_2308498 [Cantharellus anzutake]|uniref:uncharacterized protein n=1 Tax=Cantharellus anzutake TaxID=1750568 RepID=UPI001904E6E4|nr:uncharacterized protein EI90DRAFT_2308498 [Cantharellus anzutake]KAF8339957.1 hypothetical protein EI90DRAFT_2308498 [Cantharellus anzutake]